MTAGTPVVTVAITNYNREVLLAQSIESVLASTFGDFRLLVVDDGSTDGSVEVARSYARLDPRVDVVRNEHNLGDYPNRNRALSLVETPLLKYHDSDDIMYPHCLDLMVRLLRDEPRASLALSAPRSWAGGPCPMLLTPRMAYQRQFLGGGMFFCGPGGALFRTEALKRHGGFPYVGPASDFCLWLELCARENTLLVPGDLFWYRTHPGQEIQRPDAKRHYAVATVRAWQALTAPGCPLSGEELRRAKRVYMRRVLKSLWQDVRGGYWSLLRLQLGREGIPLSSFLRYPPLDSNDSMAGTPVDEKGAVPVPAWTTSAAERSPRERVGAPEES
jgi:Glycosyl transferase family 2